MDQQTNNNNRAVTKPVNLDYNDLINSSSVDLSDQIEQAFGPNGLGILTVSNIPNFSQLRSRLLPLAHQFATLPESVKEQYVHAKSNYSFGWSHGKETFNGKLDVAKGSFYANPQYDTPTTDEKLIERFPFYCCPNIWPSEQVPDLEHTFKELGQLVGQVGLLVAKQCDLYVQREYNNAETHVYEPSDKMYHYMSQSKCTKGRLLYYFPTAITATTATTTTTTTECNDETKCSEGSDNKRDNEDNWCGWHLDHDSLTGLTSALYVNGNTGEIIDNFSDANAGLFIRNRHGQVIKATWSPDQLAFQIGESAQIHSGGKLVATPHCVRGTNQPNVARCTLAVFMQPQWDVAMDPPKGVDVKSVGIPVLEEGMDFNAFTEKRLAEYYNQ